MRSRRAPRAAGVLVVAASVAIALAPGASSSQAPSAAAIENVTLVPMDRERVEPGQTVLVAEGRITWIGPSADARIPDEAVRIDGGGKFLVPGLVDVHVHVTAEDLPLFVANGVTTIREMNGSPTHLALREEIGSGRRAGPTLFVASRARRWTTCSPPREGADASSRAVRAGDVVGIGPPRPPARAE